MAHPSLADERTSFLRFAHTHKFVTFFGILVPLAVFAVFVGYPIVFTIYLSFFDWNGMAAEKTFVGLQNYRYLLVSDKYFYTALLNNVKWVGVTLFFPVLLGLIIAYDLRSRIIPVPALIRTVLLILNPLFGAFDAILQSIGLGSLVMEWFGDHRIALYTLAVVSGWAFTGMPMILYFAGLGDVPKETFDAAKIEGAGHFRMLTQVAVPQLRPVTAVVVMLTLFESLRAFDLVAVMTKGAPFGSTNVLGYLVYLESFWNSRFGYGATLSVAILVISILMATFVMKKLMKGAFDV